ncbi:MAG: hypothetical protein IJN74_02370 [Clostridia bacterium]|nr:hypothetical protein [Clostridia bacterium]
MGKRKSQTQTAATPLAEMSDRTSAFNSNDNIPQTMPFSQENSAQNTAEGFVLPTAKETMAAQGNGANANATAMDTMTDAEYDARMGTASVNKSYSIENIPGTQMQYVKADRQVIKGTDTAQWAEDVKAYIDTEIRHGKDVPVVAADGDILYITEDSSGKARFRNDVRMADGTYRKMTDEEYAVKLRTETHIDEVAEVSTRGKEIVPDEKNHAFAKDGFNYRTAYFEDFDGQYYRLTLSVGINGEINTVYNVGKIKEAQFPRGSKAKQNASAVGTSASIEGAAPQTLLAVVDENNSPTVPSNSISQNAAFSQENSAQNPLEGNVLPTAKELDRQRRAAKAETETERTGILLGVPEKIIRTVQRLAKIIGKEVVFYRNTDGKVKNDLGYYNHNDGKIYLNADAKDPVAIILGHEMVHAIQLTDGYISFFKTVLRKMQADGINLFEARAELKARYAENGVDLDTTAKIDQDLVAEYAQKHLFTDEASIASIVNADKESGHKILNFLDRILAKLGNKDARERAFVQKARALYAKALRESRGMEAGGEYRGDTASAKSMAEAKTASETMADARRETAADLRSTAEPMAGQNEARTMDTMTDEEYDARLDMEEAEASMAGQSMLYDDGRQFMIGDEENVAENKRPWYNESDEITGGKEHGQEVDNSGGRLGIQEADNRGQTTDRNGYVREAQRNGEQAGIGVHARGNTKIHTSDSEGREISSEISEKIKSTAVLDVNGRPLAVYHFTPNEEFTEFSKGDIGFHFGTKAQAEKRGKDIQAKSGRTFRAYLNLKNPIRARLDIMGWRARPAAMYLWSEGYLTNEEHEYIKRLASKEDGYDSDAAIRLREILEEKKYDGIVYPNGFEGDGDSYIAFHDEQIIKTDIENVDTESSDESSTDGRQYAIAKEDAAVSPRETSAVEEPETMESIAKTYGEVKRTRRELEKVNRRMRLSDEDKMHVGRLLRGEILPEHLPEGSDTEGILAVYEAKKEYEGYAKRIRAYNQRRKDGLRAQAQEHLGNLRKWKDKVALGGLRYSIESMERNFKDVMGEDADELISEYLKPVHKAAAASNNLKDAVRARVETLNLSRKVEKGNTVSEAHAVQLLGEAEDHIRVLKVMGPDEKRDKKTLLEWQTILEKLWKENPKGNGCLKRLISAYMYVIIKMGKAKMFDNISLTSKNMSTIYCILKERYADKLSGYQLMYGSGVIQCAHLLRGGHLNPVHFELAFARAMGGECGLDIYSRDIEPIPWYDREPSTDIDVFSYFVMNITCMFIYETSKTRVNYHDWVDFVIGKRKKFKRIVKKTVLGNKKTWNKFTLNSWIEGVMNNPLYKDWKDEIFSFKY